jgi:hypothetical protein
MIYRSRKIIVESKYGGEGCPTNLNESKECFKTCNNDLNKIDCELSRWSSWDECKKGRTCEDSYQERGRTILRAPLNGGKECASLKEKRKCLIGDCKKKSF